MACRKKLKPFSVDLSYIEALKEKPVDEEYTDPVFVCHALDIREHQIRKFNFINNKKVLIIKQRGKIYALDNVCPHMGTDLSNGILGDGRIRCSKHGSCFNIETGDIEDFPSIAPLPSYKVEINRCGQVLVRARLKDLNSAKITRHTITRDPKNLLTYLIIGGGPCSAVCVDTLRHEGFTGRIVMVCREAYLPYDRSCIIRGINIKMEEIQLHTENFYKQYDIEMFLNNEAVKANVDDRNITLANDIRLRFDKLFIATGASPKLLNVKGSHLNNVYTVRDYDDWQQIKNIVDSDKIVACLGCGFVVLEIAQTLKSNIHCKVYVIGRSQVPYISIYGHKVGERILKLYKDNDINMIMNSGVTEILGDDTGAVTHVILTDGSKLACNIFIIGIGSNFNTKFLIGSGLPLNADGSIETDVHLKTLRDNVYAGGDLAYAPVYSNNFQHACIGHFQLAQYHGHVAAINMAGFRSVQLRSVPLYSTNLFGNFIQCAGYGLHTDIIIDGDLDNLKFTAYYINEQDIVVAVVSCNIDLIASQFAELINQGGRLHGRELRSQNKHWAYRLQAIVKCF